MLYASVRLAKVYRIKIYYPLIYMGNLIKSLELIHTFLFGCTYLPTAQFMDKTLIMLYRISLGLRMCFSAL